MPPDLIERADALFARLKHFPETHTPAGPVLKPDAFAAFLDLRQLWEREVMPALVQYRRDQAEWVRVPRLEEGE